MSLELGQVAVTVLHPNGTRLDISTITDLDSMGSITEELEDDLMVLTHSDFELEVRDADGSFAELMRQTTRAEVWGIEVERYTGQRRAAWELLFAGVLDAPLSVEIDRKDKAVAVQCFSFSKLLETIDVVSFRRDGIAATDGGPDGQLAAATAGGTLITLTPGATALASIVQVGDIVALDDGTNREERTISQTISETQMHATEDFDNTYADANFTLLTPWPRDQSVAATVAAILALADIDSSTVTLDNIVGRVPFLSGFNAAVGLNVFTEPSSLYAKEDPTHFVENHNVRSRHSTTLFEALNPIDGFTLVAGSSDPEGDWTPYLTAEPAALETVPTDIGTDTQLNISPSVDDDDFTACYDHANNDTYSLVHGHTAVGDNPRLRLYLNAATFQLMDTVGGGMSDFYHTAFCDWFERSAHGFTDDIVVCSMQRHTGLQRLDIFNVGTPNDHLVLSGDGGGGGGVRTLGDRGQVAVQESRNPTTGSLNQPQTPANINFWKPVSDAALYIAKDRTLTDQPVMQMWTMRSFGNHIACLYLADSPTEASDTGFQQRATRCRVWLWETLEQVADFEVLNIAHPNMFATRATIEGVPSYVIAVNRFMRVLATRWVGTIPYINYDDVGGAQALRDIALLTTGYLTVDRHKIGRVVGRGSELNEIKTLPDTFIKHRELPLTDDFLTSISVQGKDRNGEEFEVIVGDKNDSAHRGEIKSDLIRDTGLAQAVGVAYQGLMAGQRREHLIEFVTNGQAIHANDIVMFEGRPYRVISSEIELDTDKQSLRIVELARHLPFAPRPS